MPADLAIRVDRDSVCAGDDSDPHDVRLDVGPDWTLAQLLDAALAACPLASISGGKASWLIEAGAQQGGGRGLGVIAQQWSNPRLLVPPDTLACTVLAGASPGLHFRYWCQADPEALFAALQAGTALPPRY